MALSNSYIVSGAGDPTANGTYIPVTGANAQYGGATQFTNGTDFLAFSSLNKWAITTAANVTGALSYTSPTATVTNIPLTGWATSAGTAPVPTLAAGSSAATGTNSAPSNLATATPNAIPNAPTLLTATPGNTIFTLNWTNPASLGAIVVQRRIYVAPGGTLNTFANIATLPAATAGSPATVPVTYNDTAVTNGTTYEYEVYATP